MLTVCTQPLSTTPQSWGCREKQQQKKKNKTSEIECNFHCELLEGV